MKLLAWILAAVFQVMILKMNVLHGLKGVALFAHQWAYNHIENHPSPWNWLYEALLLGREDGLRERGELQSFFVLGLYHLLVVSGKHVGAIEWMINHIFPKKLVYWKGPFTILFLTFFSLINRLQASCVRAVFAWLIRQIPVSRRIPQVDFQIVVTCFCLVLMPEWVKSGSFQLSSAGMLGLAMADSLKIPNTLLRRVVTSLFCAIAIFPLALNFQPCVSWLVLPANVFAMPLFEFVLLPATLLGTFFRKLEFISTLIFSLVFGMTRIISRYENPLLCLDERSLKEWGVVYIFILYGAWRFLIPSLQRHLFWLSQGYSKSDMTPRLASTKSWTANGRLSSGGLAIEHEIDWSADP